MALRTKTVEYPFASNVTTLAAATRLDITGTTIVIPETASRTFRSVIVEVSVHDNLTVAASLTSWLIGIKLGAVAFSDVTTTVTVTNSGDNQAYQFTRDVTAYFVTNFSGNQQAAQVGVQFGGVITLPITVKIIITYEYDDGLSVLDSGTLTAGNVNNVTDSTKSWAVDGFRNNYIKITGGTGSGQVRYIASNTATIISVSPVFTTGPDATSTYELLPGRVKTIRLPIESQTTQLTNSLAELGANQIPNLDSFIPEANEQILFKWFESVFNNGGNATTDFNLALALDAEAEVSRGTLEMALNSADWGKDIWVRNDMTTSATHAFKARSSTTARFSLLSTLLCVTYVYNAMDTTSVINSLAIPFGADAGLGHTSGAPARIRIPVWIEEPGTITLKQSGFLLSLNEATTQDFSVDVGAQSARTYTLTSGSLQTGPYHLMHRIDAGSAGGVAALTLARGLNNIDIDWYVTNISAFSNVTGILFLNYTSDIHADGEGVHNHTTVWSIFEGANVLATHRSGTPTALFNIPESNWFHNGLGFCILGPTLAVSTSFLGLEAEILSGETPGEGWRELYSAGIKAEGEMHLVLSYVSDKGQFQRWTGDPDASKLALETSRNYKLNSGTGGPLGLFAYLTYHAITFDINKTSGNYDGDGEDIPVGFYRTDTKEQILEATTGVSGAISAVWYDDTIKIFMEGREDDDHVARSADFFAGS